MAPRKAASTNTGAFDFSAVSAVPTTIPKIVKNEKPNPLYDTVVNSIGNGALMLPNIPSEHVTDAVNMLRRAIVRVNENGNDYGISIRRTENGDGTENVHFEVTARRSRAYTSADVRAWAKNNGHAVPDTGRVPTAVSDAYREAHGYKAIKRG